MFTKTKSMIKCKHNQLLKLFSSSKHDTWRINMISILYITCFVQECGIIGKKYTYTQAKDATYYIGRSLRKIGLKEGDVIALAAPNFPDAILGFLGSSAGGLIVTTINPYYTASKLL